MGANHCEHCTGHCCKYVALPLDEPETARDFDDIRWYLLHEGVLVFVEEGDWYVQFTAKCTKLTGANLCGLYETRPKICRQYKAGECDYSGGDYGYDHLFTHAEQIEAYAKQVLQKQRQQQKARRNGKSKRPAAGPRRRAG